MATTVQPARVNFRLYPGATFTEVTTLLDPDGQPVDLSARAAHLYIKRDPLDTAPIYALSTDNGGIVLDDVGQITLHISATETTPPLNPPIDPDGETWYHDLLLIDTSANPAVVDRLYQGVISVLPGITPYPTP